MSNPDTAALIAKLKTLWDFEYSHHETDSTAISVDDLEETIEALRSLADQVDALEHDVSRAMDAATEHLRCATEAEKRLEEIQPQAIKDAPQEIFVIVQDNHGFIYKAKKLAPGKNYGLSGWCLQRRREPIFDDPDLAWWMPIPQLTEDEDG